MVVSSGKHRFGDKKVLPLVTLDLFRLAGAVARASRITAFAAIASTPTATTSPTTSTSPTSSAVLAVLVPSVSPVTVVFASTVSTSAALLIWLNPSGFDVLDLIVAVLPLAHDFELGVIPLRLRVELQELLLQLLALELNEDRSFEVFIVCAAEADGIGRTVRLEECFDVKLCLLTLRPETFSVDAARHCTIFEHLDVGLFRCAQWGLALDSLPILGINEIKFLGLLQGIDDGGVWLETAHTLEAMEKFERDREILCAASLVLEEFVLVEVGIGEVELDLHIVSWSLKLQAGFLRSLPACVSEQGRRSLAGSCSLSSHSRGSNACCTAVSVCSGDLCCFATSIARASHH